MLLPPCVAIELDAKQSAASSAAIVVDRCDVVLGQGRCHLVVDGPPGDEEAAAPRCWRARVQAPTDAPLAATVVLHDPARPERRTVQRSVEFLPRDAPIDRWATLGLLIAALVTIEEHSATEADSDAESRAARALEAERAAALLKASLPRESRVAFDLRASALLAHGMMPGWAFGVRGEANLGSEHWKGQARVSYLPSRSEAGSAGGRQGGDFRLLAFGLGACRAGGGARRISARLCAGGDLNVTDVQGYGVTEPAQHTVAWGSLWVGLGVELRVFSHAALFAGIDGSVGLKRPSFTLDSGNFYQVPAVGGYGSAGLVVPF
ncbi:MAG TPA: hypothetical protein VMU50_15915 [Polyangia bacterium]|nr:hypothetical protein [Polyangia bacterium]